MDVLKHENRPHLARQAETRHDGLYHNILGFIRYKCAKSQVLDIPGIIEAAKDGKGRGR